MKAITLTKLSAAIFLASSAYSIHAAEKYWMGQSCGSQWDSQCWSATQGGGSDGAGQPQTGDNVYLLLDSLNYVGSVTVNLRDQIYSGGILNNLTIDGVGNSYSNPSYYLLRQENSVISSQNESIAATGLGEHLQVGGTNTIIETLTIGQQASGYGYYYLSGALSAKNQVVGAAGRGLVQQQDFGYGPSTNTVSDTLTVAQQAGSSGEYDLFSGTVNAQQEVIGDAGVGTFSQAGGSNIVGDTLIVGRQSGATGFYSLSAGTLSAANEVIGDGGQNNFGYGATGTLSQTGGTNTVSDTLTLGRQFGSKGNYNLYGGLLTAFNEIIGDAGVGTFDQTGGSNSVSGTLTVAKQAGSQGAYHLYGGSLIATNEIIGDASYGSFTQTSDSFGYGSTNTVTNTLTLGKQVGGYGTYVLLGGTLTANQEIIGDAGTGVFNQYGGTNSTDNLTVAKQAGSQGYYYLLDGIVNDNDAVIGDAGYGGFTQGRGEGAFYPGPSSNGGTHNVAGTLTLGKQASGYGYYYLSAGKLNAKNVVVGAAGQAWFGQGDYYGYGPTNSVNTIGDTLTIAQQAGSQGEYHLYSGSLIAANEIVGDAGNGSFTQGEGNYGYSASNSVDGTLTVGKQSGSHGVYNLIAGTLTALNEIIGDAGDGIFNQSGGSNTVNGTLTLGKQVGGKGSYNLTAGTLSAVNEVVGDAGEGTFTQGSGNFGYGTSNNVSDTLTVGKQAGSHGTYNLVAGVVSAVREIIGDAGVGIFNQSGGSHSVSDTLTLGSQAGGNGTYNLSNGTLSAADEIVGDFGTGTFTQGQGSFGYSTTNSVSGTLAVGKQAGSRGVYNLVAGMLNTLNTVVGDAGIGSFSQTGGTHTVGATLTVGKAAGGIGDYGLYGGTLNAVDEIIGDAGIGSVVQRATDFGDGAGPTYPVNNVSGTVTLGNQAGSNGAYYLHSGELNTHDTVIGNAGTGLLNQLGGKHTVAGTLTLGKQAGGSGTYNLLGGILSAANEVVGDAGTGVVNQVSGTNTVGLLTFAKQSTGSGTYNLKGGTLSVGDIANGAGTGSLSISGGALDFAAGNHSVNVGALTISDQGKIHLADNAVTAFQSDVVHNGQAIEIGANGNAVFNARFSGAGAFTGTGTVTFNGEFNPGNSPALLSVAGNMVLGESSKSVMEIDGINRGSEYDAVDVGGALTLDGELKLQFLSGYTPQAGATFDLFDAETLAGRFDLVTLIGLNDGLTWKIDYLTDAKGSTDIVRLSLLSSVPLPASVWLLQSALLGLLGARRLRKAA